MEIPFLNIMIHEPDTALTDWVLALETAIFFMLILWEKKSNMVQKVVLLSLMASLVSASFFGGLYHGFFPLKTTTSGGWLVWMLTMMSIGMTSMNLLQLSVLLEVQKHRNALLWVCVGIFMLYAWYVLSINHSFRMAVYMYLVALLVFLVVQIRLYMKTKSRSFLGGILAILLMIIAAHLQQLHIGLHPLYFNYNALYHLLQGIALLLLFLSLRRIQSLSRL